MPPGRDDGSGYLLGTRDEELERLAFQHRVWRPQARALWRRAGFRRGATIVDLGCGPGFATLELARLVGPEGRVIAVDAAPKFLDHLAARARRAGLAQVVPRAADVYELTLEPGSVDGVYARWLFCFLERPERVLACVAAGLRPGGALAVTDYANYRAFSFAPRSARLDRVVDAVQECWRRRGGDLEIQGRMPALMRAAGLHVADVRLIGRLARPGSPEWRWPHEFFRSFLPTLVAERLVEAGEAAALLEEWERRGADPDGYLLLPPLIDVIGVRA